MTLERRAQTPQWTPSKRRKQIPSTVGFPPGDMSHPRTGGVGASAAGIRDCPAGRVINAPADRSTPWGDWRVPPRREKSVGRPVVTVPTMAPMTGLGLPVPVPDVCVRVKLNVGACGPYAHIVADFEPPGPDGGLELLNTVPQSSLPAEYLPALREGLLEGLGGVAAAVLLTGGTFHDVDSSELGYKIAGQQAGRAALIGASLLPQEEADTLRWATWPGRLRPYRSSMPAHWEER